MRTNTLPGIISIHYTKCSNIQPHVMQQSITGALIDIAAKVDKINFYGIPKCQWAGSLTSGCRQEKTTLEFTTSDILPENIYLAFIITLASGKQYLIGSREPNYPQIEYNENTGDPSGDPAVRTYKITHIALKSALKCVM